MQIYLLGKEGALELLHIPVLSFLLSNTLLWTDGGLAVLTAGNAVAWALENNIDIHTVDTDVSVVLKTKIDVLLDTEAEVAGGGEAAGADFVIVNLKSLVKDVKGLLTADGNVGSDLVVTADAELWDGTVGSGEHGLLTGELLDNAAGTGNLITNGAWVDVDANLGNTDLAELVFSHEEKGGPNRPN